MTTVQLRSAVRVLRPGATWFARAAAVLSVALGGVLLRALPALGEAAGYAALLVGTCAVAAICGGCGLWTRSGLLAPAVVTIASLSAAVIEGLHLTVGLPGVFRVDDVTHLESVSVLVLAGLVLASLGLDLRLRRPERAPEHPYAL